MAQKSFDNTGYLDPGDYHSSVCMWCRRDCYKVEILWTGEAVEVWCYCEHCNTATWHPIFNKETNPEPNEDNTRKQ